MSEGGQPGASRTAKSCTAAGSVTESDQAAFVYNHTDSKADITCTTDADTREDGPSVFDRNIRPRQRLPTQFKQKCLMCLCFERLPVKSSATATVPTQLKQNSQMFERQPDEVICERHCADTVSDDDTTQSAREPVQRVHSS